MDTVFIVHAQWRIEDPRRGHVLDGRRIKVKRALVVPGSHAVKAQAEAEGLHHIFTKPARSGANRAAMCLAMNPDKLAVGERAPARAINFEGRQVAAVARICLPAMAAAQPWLVTFHRQI